MPPIASATAHLASSFFVCWLQHAFALFGAHISPGSSADFLPALRRRCFAPSVRRPQICITRRNVSHRERDTKCARITIILLCVCVCECGRSLRYLAAVVACHIVYTLILKYEPQLPHPIPPLLPFGSAVDSKAFGVVHKQRPGRRRAVHTRTHTRTHAYTRHLCVA